MSEAQILNAIANYFQDEKLIFQVIVADREAHIYLNRLLGYEIDYSQLTENIVAAVSNLDDANIDRVCLYSRISGETEPDWQTEIDLVAIASEPEIVESEETREDLPVLNESVTPSADLLVDPALASEAISEA